MVNGTIYHHCTVQITYGKWYHLSPLYGTDHIIMVNGTIYHYCTVQITYGKWYHYITTVQYRSHARE